MWAIGSCSATGTGPLKKSRAAVSRGAGFLNPAGWPGFELGWTLGREFWGKGYATEGARRALKYAFAELHRDHVISLIQPENKASIRVAERLGEKLEGQTEVFDHEVLIYGLDRADWHAEIANQLS